MTDEAPRLKRMGRPPKHPDQGKRPSLSLRVSQSLYDQIAAAADENGRSLSEEMEARVNAVYSQNATEITAKAVAVACQNMDEDRLKFFHGNDGHMWAKLSADLYRNALMSTAVEVGPESTASFSDEFIAAFTAKIRDGQDQIIKTWKNGMLFARMAERMNRPGFAGSLKEALSNNKDLVEKLATIRSQPPSGKGDESE